MEPAGRLSSIQCLRALAALAVLLRHCFDGFKVGGAGVDLFFIISGFVMIYSSRELFGSAKSAVIFARLRLIRIVPPYWIATTILILIVGAPSMDHLLKSLLFVTDGEPFLAPGWTLNFEMLFYALFACFIFLPMRTAIKWLSGTILAIVLIGPYTRISYIHYVSHPILLEFIVGVLAGFAFIKGVRLDRRMSICMILAAILLLFGLSATLPELPMRGTRVVMWGLPAAILFIGAVFGPSIQAIEIRPIVTLGNASYSLYLTHIFFVMTFGAGNPIATIVFSVVFAIGFFHVVEAPTVDFLRHWMWRPSDKSIDAVAPARPVVGATVIG